jgi:2-succinyl-5-enolpyruvyl-6-hydroxy-3-cyclohexene-1-carboxylate synthase
VTWSSAPARAPRRWQPSLRASSELRCWVHLDERAGAFFALGMAKAGRRAAAILVTSGTAAAELTPALVEAHYGRVPLIALTADRPPELRERGAPQSIDQDHLFGRFAKWYSELPVPETHGFAEAHVRGVIGRAVAVATSAPAGPVHLNLPFREPLLPAGEIVPAAPSGAGAHTLTHAGERALPGADLERLARRVAGARRGIIVCGPLDREGFGPAVAGLAAASGFPVIADALSNVRFGAHDRSHLIARADALVRITAFAEAHQPELVVRLAARPPPRRSWRITRPRRGCRRRRLDRPRRCPSAWCRPAPAGTCGGIGAPGARGIWLEDLRAADDWRAAVARG